MSKLEFLTTLVQELSSLLRSAAAALEHGELERAEELIDDVARAATNTKEQVDE